MATTLTSNLTQTIIDVYSRDIWFAAQPVLRFEQFAVKKTDLQAAPGTQIRITVYNNLTLGAALTEGTAIVPQALGTTQKTISVTEFGNAVSVSELLLQASFDDVMGSAAKLLGIDYAKTLDTKLRDTVIANTTNIVYAGSKASRAALAAGDVLTSKEIKDAVELLATNNAAKYNNDYYVAFIHPHHARRIRDDGEFQTVTSYGKQYAGEIGRINDVVFIETTQMPTVASTVTVYQATMFGENAYGLAIALPVEMRDGGIQDFGRTHSLAWYSIFGAAILLDQNIVRIETN